MLALLACAVALRPQQALEVSQPSLISSISAYQPGKAFLVGIKFTMKPQWHVYWRNPGDSGQEARVKWSLPKGWKASEIYWPRPESFTDSGMTTFIYSREVVLPVLITPSSAAEDATIGADVSWLVCGEACIPGMEQLSLSLAAGRAPEIDPSAADEIQGAMSKTPGSKGTGTATKKGKQIVLRLKQKPGADAVFLPYDRGVLEHGQKQAVSADGTISLPASTYFNAKETKRLRGIVLHSNDPKQRPIEIDAPLQILGG